MAGKIQFLKRPGCHLCDEAGQTLARACRVRGLTYDVIDIDQVPGFEKFSEEIPVLLVDGRKALKHHFLPSQLSRILDRLQ
ncbi:MAG: glutaredoxin family protein [Acidobacteria bacterium]|nr:glutaredoxin family protein [Acidobacteriota bacterium]